MRDGTPQTMSLYFESDKIKNAHTVAKYGARIETGIPALLLLDVHGRVVRPNDPVSWRTARGVTAPQVLDYLRQLAAAANDLSLRRDRGDRPRLVDEPAGPRLVSHAVTDGASPDAATRTRGYMRLGSSSCSREAE